MVSMLRSWWQKIKQHPVATGVIGFVVVVVIALVFAVAWFNGTGFDGYNQVTTAHTISGPSAGTVVRTEVYQPGKALWDWLQLLIIPAVLVVGGFLLNYTTSRNERQANEQRAKTERDIATDNQREAALQAYIDKISELLMHEHLGEPSNNPHVNPHVKNIAQARTATVLRILDPIRRGSLIRFLSQSYILKKCVEDALAGTNLQGADLSGLYLEKINLGKANLQEANLREANLREANLSGANLQRAILWEANLQRAKLEGADLRGARLYGADLQEALLWGTNLERANLEAATITQEQWKQAKSLAGATMPDGTKHA